MLKLSHMNVCSLKCSSRSSLIRWVYFPPVSPSISNMSCSQYDLSCSQCLFLTADLGWMLLYKHIAIGYRSVLEHTFDLGPDKKKAGLACFVHLFLSNWMLFIHRALYTYHCRQIQQICRPRTSSVF